MEHRWNEIDRNPGLRGGRPAANRLSHGTALGEVMLLISFLVPQQPNSCLGCHIVEISTSHTISHTTLCRIPLEEWSALSRDLCLTTPNTHNRQTSVPPAGFEPAIPASEICYLYAPYISSWRGQGQIHPPLPCFCGDTMGQMSR
jgi:hypothetical protein